MAQQEDGGESAVEENGTEIVLNASRLQVPFSSTADSPPSSCCAVGAVEIPCLMCFYAERSYVQPDKVVILVVLLSYFRSLHVVMQS